MRIEQIEQIHIQMTLKHPFETSFGVQTVMDKIILAVHQDGATGWGETPLFHAPSYSYETIETAWHIQRDFLLPMLLDADIKEAADLPALFAPVRGHPMAKAGIEAAVWDLRAKQDDVSLAALLGGVRSEVPVGVSIGVQADVDALVERVGGFLEAGYQRIKVKVKPGWDVEPTAALRQAFPDAVLMADANSAYALGDMPIFRLLDTFNLLMIEQPLAYDDLIEHAALQAEIATPICLDESITGISRARDAIRMGSGRVVNLKPTRVGGWANARAIHDLCVEHSIDLWIGGMLESGIGRAHNLALASLPGVTLPGDISATDRYWHEDIIDHDFSLNQNGTMTVPVGSGIGVEVVRSRLDALSVRREVYSARR